MPRVRGISGSDVNAVNDEVRERLRRINAEAYMERAHEGAEFPPWINATPEGVMIPRLNASLHYENLSRAGCLVCNVDDGTEMACDVCDGAFHPRCVGLQSIPRGPWCCSSCIRDGGYTDLEAKAGPSRRGLLADEYNIGRKFRVLELFQGTGSASRAIQSLLLHLDADIEYVSVDINDRWKPTITGDVRDWKRIVNCLKNTKP